MKYICLQCEKEFDLPIEKLCQDIFGESLKFLSPCCESVFYNNNKNKINYLCLNCERRFNSLKPKLVHSLSSEYLLHVSPCCGSLDYVLLNSKNETNNYCKYWDEFKATLEYIHEDIGDENVLVNPKWCGLSVKFCPFCGTNKSGFVWNLEND